MEVLDEWHTELDPTFMRHGACVGADTNLFFPKRGDVPRKAIRVCNGTQYHPPCPVKQQCLDYAMSLPATLVGVWGGTTQQDRRRLRYERDKQARLKAELPEGQPVTLRTWPTSSPSTSPAA